MAHLFDTPGTYQYTVPAGVNGINAVGVGGGGSGGRGDASNYGGGGSGAELSWRNGIPVVPGEVLTIVVGAGGIGPTSGLTGNDGGDSRIERADGTLLLLAAGGLGALYAQQTPGGTSGDSGGLYTNHPGGEGGRGYWTASGGGAGGYSGPGGNGGNTLSAGQSAPGTAGQGGGGGGADGGGFGGGGVGVLGEGESGAAGEPGKGGSGGEDGRTTAQGRHGGAYGGGGGGNYNATPGNGGSGAVFLVPAIMVSGVIYDETGTPCRRAVYLMTRPTDGSAPILLTHGRSDAVTGEYELGFSVDGLPDVTLIVIAEDPGTPGPTDPVLPDLAHRVVLTE